VKHLKRKVLCLLAASSLFAGACTLDSWKLAVGPIFGGSAAYGGVELGFNNGVDFVVPLVGFGG